MVSISKGATGHYIPTQSQSNIYRAAIPAATSAHIMKAAPQMSMANGQQISSLSMNAPQKSGFTGLTKMTTSYAPKGYDRRAQFMAMSAAYDRVDGPTSFGQPVKSSGPTFGQASIPSLGFPGV